jgi:hypothetical protein
VAGYFYPLPPAFIGGRQPYAPKLGIAQSGPPSQPTRALATLGIILASWAQAAPALPKQVKIAPLIPVAAAAANPPYTRKQFESIDAAWRADVTTVITLTSIAPSAEPPPDPDVAPIKGYKTVDLILGQWKAREYRPPQPNGLAPLLPPAVVPDAPPVRSHALLKSILDQSLPAAYRPQVSKPIAALLPVAAVPDYPPPSSDALLNLVLQQWAPRAWWPLPRSQAFVPPTPDTPPVPGGTNFDIIAEQWVTDAARLPQGAKFAPLLEPISQSDAPPAPSNTNFATVVRWWEQHGIYDLPTSSWTIHVDVEPVVVDSRVTFDAIGWDDVCFDAR